MCLHKCNYIILYLRYVLIDNGTPDSITSLFDLVKLFTKRYWAGNWILALYKYIIIIII